MQIKTNSQKPRWLQILSRAYLIALGDALRSSFWFIPGLLTMVGIACGIMMPIVDARLGSLNAPPLSWFETTSEASRSTLAALSGALITVTSVVFSVMMVIFSLTTSQFGSRLLRTFTEKNLPQFTMGTFLATSIYCLLVLRSVRTIEGEPFVPHLSTALAVVAALASMILFIVFTHYVAESIQAQSVVRSVAHDLDLAIDGIFPNAISDDSQDKEQAADRGANMQTASTVIPGIHEGYLQAIDYEGLLQLIQQWGAELEIRVRPGEFLIPGQPLVRVSEHAIDPQEASAQLNSHFFVGIRRTPRQDLECAVLELVEVGVRALSPGINDPFTAIACIDYLSASLCRLLGRQNPPDLLCDDDGRPRVKIRSLTFPSVLDAAFHQFRQYGASSPAILLRLLERLDVLASMASRECDRNAIRRHAEIVNRAGKQHFSEPNDLQDLDERYQGVLKSLEPPPNASA